MGQRRIILRDTNLSGIYKDIAGNSIKEWFIDVTRLDHANVTADIFAIVQEQCNLMLWHDISSTVIPPWGRADFSNPDFPDFISEEEGK